MVETYVDPSRRHTLSASTPWEFLMMWRRVQRGWQLGAGWGPRLLTGTIFYVFRHFACIAPFTPRSEKTVARLGTGSETPCDLRTLKPRRLRSRLSDAKSSF